MRNRKWYRALPALAVALALGVAACGGSSESSSGGGSGGSSSAGDADNGKKLYAATCSSCHGPDATGLPNLGKDLTTSTFAKDKTDDELVAFIVTGRNTDDPANTTGVAMPPKGGNPALTEEDLGDVVAYLRTLEQ